MKYDLSTLNDDECDAFKEYVEKLAASLYFDELKNGNKLDRLIARVKKQKQTKRILQEKMFRNELQMKNTDDPALLSKLRVKKVMLDVRQIDLTRDQQMYSDADIVFTEMEINRIKSNQKCLAGLLSAINAHLAGL